MRKIPAVKAVIFDCDGTLVDSETLACEALVKTARDYGVLITLRYALDNFVGGDIHLSIKQLERLKGERLPDSFITDFRQCCKQLFKQRLKPLSGAKSLLKSLSCPIAIASNGPLEKINDSLKFTGLDSFFSRETVFSAFDIKAWKPDPELYLYAATQLKLRPEECLVVEDSRSGTEAALKANMRVCVLNPSKALIADFPQLIPIDNLTMLKEMLSAAHQEQTETSTL